MGWKKKMQKKRASKNCMVLGSKFIVVKRSEEKGVVLWLYIFFLEKGETGELVEHKNIAQTDGDAKQMENKRELVYV